MGWFRRERHRGRHHRRPARTVATPAGAATAPPSGRHEVDIPTDPRLRSLDGFAPWYQGGAADPRPPLLSRPRPVAAQASPPPRPQPPPSAPTGEQAGPHQIAALAQARRRTGPPTRPQHPVPAPLAGPWPPAPTPSGRHHLREA